MYRCIDVCICICIYIYLDIHMCAFLHYHLYTVIGRATHINLTVNSKIINRKPNIHKKHSS